MSIFTRLAVLTTFAAVMLLSSPAGAKSNAFKLAISSYGAESGAEFASAPKIRPDGKMYYLYGKIQAAGENPRFLARLAPPEENEPLANALRRSRSMGESTEYFAVVVPDILQDYYFDNAKIGGGFDLIGRYSSNTKYETVSGRTMQAPVFEAVYLDLWSKRQPPFSAYTLCINNAQGIMPDMIDCASEEATRQDARLNAAYKIAMEKTADRNALRARQRLWIKERDKACVIDQDGGQAAILTYHDCLAQKSAQRAHELESIDW